MDNLILVGTERERERELFLHKSRCHNQSRCVTVAAFKKNIYIYIYFFLRNKIMSCLDDHHKLMS